MRYDYSQIKKEVDICLFVWKELLLEFFKDSIDLIYAKGSAVKSWDSYIDYVPLLSDVDIHFFLKNSHIQNEEQLFNIQEAVTINKSFETKFIEKCPNYFHIPRIQVMCVNKFEKDRSFVHLKKNAIRLLYGDWKFKAEDDWEFIRNSDYSRFKTDFLFMQSVPEKLFDRNNLDYWTLIRNCSWRLSPAPYRFLTQLSSINPLHIWGWNRTKVCNELEQLDYNKIVRSIQNYYKIGWENYETKFSRSNKLRDLIVSAYTCYKTINEEIDKAKDKKK